MLIRGKYFVPESEFSWQFIQSPGPGGQNVNKVATTARLTFSLAATCRFDAEVKARLLEKLAGKLNDAGELVVVSRASRSQSANRREAVRKLEELLTSALVEPKKRRPTRPTAASVRRRLAAKAHRAGIKRERRNAPERGE